MELVDYNVHADPRLVIVAVWIEIEFEQKLGNIVHKVS
jgi:hypothetical protein